MSGKKVWLINDAGRRTGAAAALVLAALGALLLTVACGGQAAATPTRAAAPGLTLSTSGNVGQSLVRFTAGDAEVVVRIADNPTSRDFVSLLPLTLDFRDFNTMEKIGDLPRRLATQGFTGGAPANADLIYFAPWGNLGLFYNTGRRDVTFDNQVFPIGTVVTGYDRLNALETGPVRAELVQ